MDDFAVSHNTSRSFLVITQPFFGRPKDLALQAAQDLATASRRVARLFLNLADESPESTVDLVCVHDGLLWGNDRLAI